MLSLIRVFKVLVLYLRHTTEPRKSLGTWLREISPCSCLTVLPGPAWVLLSKICKDFFSALYTFLLQGINRFIHYVRGASSAEYSNQFD